MKITLIGYRGSGKSSVGKKLANKLWFDFADSDTLISQRAGMTIKDIFEKEGESGFRAREAAVIQELAAKDDIVIAAGGGAVLDPANVAALKRGGKIIFLTADPATLHARIQADTQTLATRPNLIAGTGAGGIDEIKSVLALRLPIYQSAADITLEVANLTIDEAAVRLVSLI